MRFIAMSFVIILLSSYQYANAGFEGDLELTPEGCYRYGKCTLKNPLSFTDSKKLIWQANAGLLTDGASIPGVFQPFVGKPFDQSFIKAAVIHDHYCDRKVRSWRQTHRVFYEGLIAEGVPESKAKTMYFAVLLGGPKWLKLLPGKDCGQSCINNYKSNTGLRGIYSRVADYSAADIAPAMKSLSEVLENNPDQFSIDDLEKEARKMRPNDIYFLNGDSIEASRLGIRQE